ncbi:killer cell lectin-like receptor subfamily F member 1 isoform X2 [Hemicordylus capensis]|uniref:killer cell lectin-like receptor subfamily F member 1 isoform X2 n=1 Tax=Hemicordylus capensis TaxID=884348 RepID=UPI0023021BB3|nr:killer cell lectin-like receptor subfamily F member 1 isoform X2 [Hemicordylus capensis]
MEDEEGYMALNRLSSHSKRTQDMSRNAMWHKISMGILVVTCIILGSAVIGLSVLVFQGSFHKRETAELLYATEAEGLPGCSSCFEELTQLKSDLCESPTEKRVCALCPMNWVPRKGKCYWFSKETSKWIEAQDYCFRRGAQMLVVQDLEEKEFIQNRIEGKFRFWIGLNFTVHKNNWTWIDSSVLDPTLFLIPPPPTSSRCGVLKVDEIISEMCTDQFKWICEKEGIILKP